MSITTNRSDVKEFLRSSIKDALAQCTERQQAFFHKIYPKGVNGIADSNLQTALELCERTIAKNNRNAS